MWENRHHFLTPHVLRMHSNVSANRTKVSQSNSKGCSNHECPSEQLKSDLVGTNRTRTRSLGLRIWKVMRRSAWKDIANWRMKRLINSLRSLHHALTTITSKKRKNLKRWENCQKFSLKSAEMSSCGTGWVDRTFYGPSTNWHEQSQNGREHVTQTLLETSKTQNRPREGGGRREHLFQ